MRPVYNPLSYDGGRCEFCDNRATIYFDVYQRNGDHAVNLFVCSACAPETERSLQSAGLRVRVVGGAPRPLVIRPAVQLDIDALLEEAA